MTNIDFYILADTTWDSRLRFACRLTEKAWRLGKKVCLITDERSVSEQVDQLLWEFRPESFIPHQILTEDQTHASESVIISHQLHLICEKQHHELMINLCSGKPDRFSRFERLCEIVIQNESVLSSTRQNFSFYRNRGYPIRTHDLRTKV